MNNGLPAELFYILTFVAIVLFQYVMKRFGPPEAQDAPSQEQVEQFPEELTVVPAAVPATAVSSIAVGHFGRVAAPNASSAVPGRRFSRKSLMGSTREMQNAVAVATILGPCRTFEPYDAK